MKSKNLLITILFLFIGLSLYAQSKSELEKRKVKNLNEISKVNDLLNATLETKSKTVKELQILNKRIELRNNLIYDIEQQISNTEKLIFDKENVIASLEKDLARKKKEYEDLIFVAYKNKNNYNKVMYVFAAEDINEAYKRYKYLKHIAVYRKKQALIIKEIKKVQEQKLLELTIAKQEKEVLLLQRKEEFALLSNEKSDKNTVVKSLSGKERDLRKQLKEKEKILARVEMEIKNIIDKETGKTSGTLYERLTPQERITSSEFAKNKGSLPWPTSKGVITAKFGLQSHPVLRGVKTNNNGVDITSIKYADVKAVFTGSVSLIAAIPGGNYAIIIKHGQYFSVYQNVVKVQVKQGDKIDTNQIIGKVFAADNQKTGTIHFEIRKERQKLNPEDWLAN